MLRNYFKIALRNLRRNRVISAINIFGLAAGLAACLLIVAYVRDETHYDRYALRAKDIYRVNLGVTGNVTARYPMVDNAVGPGMAAAYPDIEASTRLELAGEQFFTYGDKMFKEQKTALVDSNFFTLFTIPFLEGDARTALIEPHSLVITRALATKYFGNGPALDRTISLASWGPCKITGIIEKIPDASHFHFDAFLSMSTNPIRQPSWTNLGFYTYLLLRPGADPKRLEARFPDLVAEHAVPEIARDMGVSIAEAKKAITTFVFTLTPLVDIHLHSDTKYELEANGSSHYIFIFVTLALFILGLACANFTNLSTAGAAARAREIGIRKVMGSLRKQLIGQFLMESTVITAMAMVLAWGLVLILLPYFNEVAGKRFGFGLFLDTPMLLAAAALTIVVGIGAGLYPAFFLSAFKTIKVLKGNPLQGHRKSLLRSGLVVVQFFISIALIVATVVVYRQLHFMQDKRLGYDQDHVLFIQDANLLGNNQDVFRQQLLTDKRVAGASLSSNAPGSGHFGGTEIYPKETGPGDGHEMHTDIFNVDYDFVPTLGLEIIKGRTFTRGFPTDSTGVVINETAASDLGWGHTDPIGKIIIRSGRPEYHVIGVVKDFHYLSVKQKIAPLMLLLGHNAGGVLVKINTADIGGFLNDTKQLWRSFNATGPFNYYFLDDHFANLYVAEQRTGSLFTAFTAIAILIAALGLFGLAAYMVEQRTREIGIRKVLGASVTSVLLLVSKEFLWLVAIAFAISVPISWWAMNRWLEDFAYRTSLSWWIFPLAGIAALLVAVFTISFQSAKAATANPIDSLRNE